MVYGMYCIRILQTMVSAILVLGVRILRTRV